MDQRVDADIAVIDTGSGPHPDLNVVVRTDCITTSKCIDGTGLDGNGHGTHVAGTAAALDNGFGIVGTAPGARIWSVKVLGDSGTGTLSALVAGIDWVTARADRIDVANISIQCGCVSVAIDTALSRTTAAGVTTVVAAGNSARDAGAYSISNSPDVVTVSALADFDGISGGAGSPTCRPDIDDTLADFSNYGTVVDVAAPGTCIRSTYLGAGYADLSGTSMAAPHVTGAAALLTTDPAYTGDPVAIRSRLVADGNYGWTDDSPDGVLEPLLDLTAVGTTTLPTAARLTVAVDNAWIEEGESAEVIVRANRPLAGGEVVTALLSTKNGSATSGTDYLARTSVPIRLDAVQDRQVVEVSTLSDTVREDIETLTATLSAVIGAGVADSSSTITIYDTSGQLSLSIGNVTAAEGNAAQAQVRLSEPVPDGNLVTARLSAGSGTATSGVDFAPVATQTLTFGPGVQTIDVPLSLLDDGVHELDETFTLSLSSITGARAADASALVTITDDEGPLQMTIGDAWRPEGDVGGSPLAFTVRVWPAPAEGQPVSVKVQSANGTAVAGSDYLALPSTLVAFAPGETSRTVSVTVLGDSTIEANETVKLVATSVTGAVLADNTGIGTLANDDGSAPTPAPRWLSLGDGFLTESGAGQSGVVELTLSAPPDPGQTVSATVRSVDGNAKAASDYQSVSTTVVFGAGQTTAAVPVAAIADALPELQETFTLTLSSVTGATVADSGATVRITSDQAPIRVTVGDLWLVEGATAQQSADVPIQLSEPPGSGQTVSLAVSTAAGSASAGSDFTAFPSTTLTFGPGETSRIVSVSVNGDTLHEGLETFTISLKSASGLVLEDTAATVTIVDEEGPVTAWLADAEASEGDAGANGAAVTVMLSDPVGAGQTFTVRVATTTGGTAIAGTDYTGVAGVTLTLAAGQTSGSTSITVFGDTVGEQHETVLLGAASPTGGLVLADASGVLTIENDD